MKFTLIYIDETALTIDILPKKGYQMKGQMVEL